MNFDKVDELMNGYIDREELSSASISILKGDECVYKNKWGYSSLEDKTSVQYDSIFRLMSMSKIITAISILKLYDQGKLDIYDPISKYDDRFLKMRVVDDPKWTFTKQLNPLQTIWKFLTFNKDKVKSKEATREVTFVDLLSHSSGLQQGIYGLLRFMKERKDKTTLNNEMNVFSSYLLDFQPGEGTSYSPIAGFDVLGYLVEKISGKPFADYIREDICIPLDMKDTFFYTDDEEQKKRIVKVYKRKKDHLVDVSNSKEDVDSLIHRGKDGYPSGSGGLYSTLVDYSHIGEMLLHYGLYDGKQFLKRETVELMQKEAPKKHLEPEPGQVWGLGVRIRQDKEKGKFAPTVGTYGWSGAFGTHFFVSPKDDMAVIFMTNRTDLGGSSSYVSSALEDVIFNKCLGE